MYHKGVTREIVIETAIRMAEERGLNSFSMNQLAGELGIRTASLYKHVSGLEDVITGIGLYALTSQKEDLLNSIEGLHGDEAIMALACAYRRYAVEHPELYRTILSMQNMSNETLERESSMITEPIVQVLEDYHLTQAEKNHWQRILRSYMHGFIAHEEAGYFIHYPESKEDTYRLGIRCFIHGLYHRGRFSDENQHIEG